MLANHNAIEDSGYVIERSLRFMAASSQSLARTPSVAGDRRKFTWSAWVKRGVLGANQLFAADEGTIYSSFSFLSDNRLEFFNPINTSATEDIRYTTTAVFRDQAAFMHIMLVADTTESVAADRIKMYVNGARQTLTVTVAASLNRELNVNRTILTTLGRFRTSSFLDGYMSEVHFIDGQALTPSSFGEINPTTGQWVAKKYTGTYGTNGTYLDFKDGTSTTTLGQDKSGNGNNWTLTNFTRSAGVNDCWMLDVPTGNGSASAVQPSGNYAVLNPLDTGTGTNITLSKANLMYSQGVSTGAVRASMGMSSGKWYWEVTVTATNPMIGISNSLATTQTYPGSDANGWAYYGLYGTKYTNGASTAYGATYTTNDVIGVAFDADIRELTFYKNNVSQGVAFTGLSANTYFPAIGRGNGSPSAEINFGQRSFAYTPPTGFKALCTANLSTPSIKKPSDHFIVQLSTGANIKTDSEALFTNELEWIKDRANANNHQLIDAVRGSNAVLQSNTTGAETTYTAPSGSSVGWVWRASDSAPVSNTSGSITSQVSANTTAGFSIVTYTGTGATATVGHGLGISPSLVIVKRRDATANWQVRHSSIAVANSIQLNLTNAQASATTVWNSTSPTSSVFSLGTSTDVNASGGTYVAYCFSEIAGYSKFGSYTGNGSADGLFVYLGFKPKFVMIKRTDTTSDWIILDSSRAGYNVDNDQIYPNLTNAEATTDLVDLTSNGFKVRSTDVSINANGGTYIYMAFAETPFQYANAR